MTLNFIFNFFQMKREFSLDLSTQSLVQVNVTRLVPVNPAPSWILSPRKKRFHVFDIHHGLGDLGEKHVWVWKRCFLFFGGEENPLPPAKNVTAEVRFVSFVIFWFLMLLLVSPWQNLAHFGKLRFCQRVVKRWYQTQPVHHPVLRIGCLTSPSEFKSGDGCSCDRKLLYRRGWWYNHSSKDTFFNLSVSIILGFASPKNNAAGCAGCHWPTTPSSGIACSCSAYWGSLLSLLLHMMLCFDSIL